MKALLVGGPEHGRTLEVSNSPTIVVPKRVEPTLDYYQCIEGLPAPCVETVVYNRRPGTTGGYVLYVAEDAEADERPVPLNERIRAEVRALNLRFS